MKTVDVMIPVYKAGPDLDLLLTRLEKQTYPIDHIFIINTEKDCWDQELGRKHPCIQVEHISKPEFDHGGTRRKLAAKSGADLLIFMTQDALPEDKELIAHLAGAFDKERVKAAYARQLPRCSCRMAEAYARTFNYPAASMVKGKEDLSRLGIKTYFCSNVCAAYDRVTYEALGGFVQKTIFNEDMIYAGKLVQAGYQIAYCAEAKVYHSHNYSCKEQFKRNFDLGVSQAQHPEIFQGLPSEGEGIQMVKRTLSYLWVKKRKRDIPNVILQSGFKYLGYLMGTHYESLPRGMVLKFTMNREYWN